MGRLAGIGLPAGGVPGAPPPGRRALLAAAESRLAAAGATRLQAIIASTSPHATGFWRASGWVEQVERLRFVRR